MDIETLSALAEKKIQVGDESFQAFRKENLATFKKAGFGFSDKDYYKFTSLQKFFGSMKSDTAATSSELAVDRKGLFPTIVFKDGVLEAPPAMAGVKISSLKDRFSDLKTSFTHKNALSELHHSLVQDGILIEVDKKIEVETPIRILHLISQAGLPAPTVFVHAKAFSKITLIEESISTKDISYAQVSETYITVDESAHVEHIQMEKGMSESLHHGSTFATVAKDATYKNVVFHLSGKMNRRNLELNLTDAGANGESYNLFLTNGTEHSDIHTTINHKAADTTSSQIAKGILDGESKGIFTGKIHIFPQAQRVASSQLNKNLLLAKKAQVHSQPQLEIFADDVKCSHGSTTGQLSNEELFYFEARGIPAERARTLLAHGFGLEIVLKISNLAARADISRQVLDLMKEKFKIGHDV